MKRFLESRRQLGTAAEPAHRVGFDRRPVRRLSCGAAAEFIGHTTPARRDNDYSVEWRQLQSRRRRPNYA